MTSVIIEGGFRWRRLGCAAGALALAVAGQAAPALAQAAPSVSRPVVQPLPSRESQQLTSALSRLGRDPRDTDALIDAGNAALAMGDFDAAAGFFKRADQVAPSDARAKAGLAAAMMHGGDPVAAISLFEAAEKAGAPAATIEGERGLAYDLVGDNATAQYYYRQALARGPDEEISRRLALSLAIGGDSQAVDAVLLPMLRQQDKAAWRVRVFSLAILGKPDEAIRVAQSMLPEGLAGSMAPYLRYMPRLTAAQQAAAANLGNFPRASEIGRDDPRIAQYVAQTGKRTTVAGLGEGLVPKGAPLGGNASAKTAKREKPDKSGKKQDSAASLPAPKPTRLAVQTAEPAARSADRVAPPEPMPSRGESAAAPAAPKPVTAVAATPAPKAPPVAAPVTAAPSASARGIAAPGFDLASVPRDKAPPAAGAAQPEPAGESPDRVSLAEAFRDLGKPEVDLNPSSGAVDIRKITPAKPAPEPKPEKAEKEAAKPAKPAPPSHPSRIWVQMEVGRNKSALAFDWRKYTRQSPAVFRGKKPYISAWGQTNRMLIGPFDNEKAAKDYIADLKKAGVDGPHVWISPAGQVVDSLPTD